MNLLLILALSASLQERLPVPDQASQDQAEKELRELFSKEFADKRQKVRVALAKTLVEEAGNTKDAPAACYVLLRDGAQIAAEEGDIETCMRAVDGLSEIFAVDPLDLKPGLLTTLTKSSRDPKFQSKVAAAQLNLAEEAVVADRYDEADKAVRAAGTAARRVRNEALTARVSSLQKEIRSASARYKRVKSAFETLKTAPEDAAANLVAGEYLCLVKGKWKAGLKCLAKGADGPLKQAAAKDLQNPAKPSEQASVANAWWDLATGRDGEEKVNLAKRALLWYTKAGGKLDGIIRLKAEKGLRDAENLVLESQGWFDYTKADLYDLPGATGYGLRILGTPQGVSARLKKFPEKRADGLTVRVAFQAKGLGLFTIRLDEPVTRDLMLNHGSFSGISWVGNPPQVRNDFYKKGLSGETFVLTILLEDGAYLLKLDGKEVARVPTEAKHLPPFKFRLNHGEVLLDQIRLRMGE